MYSLVGRALPWRTACSTIARATETCTAWTIEAATVQATARCVPASAVAVRPFASQGAYHGKKRSSEKKKNTYGSNEYRKKKAQERKRREGIDWNINDVPIQSVSEPILGDLSVSSRALPRAPVNAAMCCGCGAAFQSSFQDAPGFLPPDQLEKFVGRRMTLFQTRQAEEEKRKQEAAKLEEEQKRQKKKKKSKKDKDAVGTSNEDAGEESEISIDVNPTSVHVDNASEPAPGAVAGDESSASSASASSAAAAGSSTAAEAASPSWSETLNPDIVRHAKLDPKRPLDEQDLTLALNHGFLQELELQALGVDESMIITKKQLNELERAERDALREQRGEGMALRCVRCFQLANYGYTKGQVSTVRAEDFRTLLRSRFLERGGRSCVILKVVDLFDFHGSFIRDFSDIVGGRNPFILVANKFDLLPRGVGENRLRAWIKAEAERYGLHFHSIAIVSAKTGFNLWQLSLAAQKLADPDPVRDRPRRDIYIVGTTNVGKSSIVNKLIEKRIISSKGQFEATKIRTDDAPIHGQGKELTAEEHAEDSPPLYLSSSSFLPPSLLTGSAERDALLLSTFNVQGGRMTESIVPGTTLGMVSFPFVPTYTRTGEKQQPVQHVLYDTPGVINPEQLSNLLTFNELRHVVPKNRVQPLTYRLKRGQCLLLGALARLDFVDGDRDYLFVTVFASRHVTVHITQIARMDQVPKEDEKKDNHAHVNGARLHEDADDEQLTQPVTDAELEEAELFDQPVAPLGIADADDVVPTATTGNADEGAAVESSSSSISSPSSTVASPPIREIGYLEFVNRHGGRLISPPFTPERCRELGLHVGTRVRFDFHGRGWMDACEDVVFPGLGWVSVTGSGRINVRAIIPGKTKAYAREPLMPFEARTSKKKW